MSDSALVKKLKLKPRQHAAIVGAPGGYLDQLQPLPEGVEVSDVVGSGHERRGQVERGTQLAGDREVASPPLVPNPPMTGSSLWTAPSLPTTWTAGSTLPARGKPTRPSGCRHRSPVRRSACR